MNAQGKHESSTDLLVMLLRSLRGSQAAGSPRSGESRPAGEGGQPTGWPPAPGPTRRAETPVNPSSTRVEAALAELVRLMCRVPDQERSPGEFRRAAELWEFLGEPATARRWWHQAALRGDEDAIDYLALLDEEAAIPGWDAGALSCTYLSLHSPQQTASVPAAVDEYAALYKLIAPLGRRRKDSRLSKEEVLIREIEDFLHAHQSTTEAGWPN